MRTGLEGRNQNYIYDIRYSFNSFINTPNPLITVLTESHIAPSPIPNSREEERKSDLAYATGPFFLLLILFASLKFLFLLFVFLL